ncbi:MAG: TauD/TfdA family dioxygenase [Acidimicrobiales bacterium]
MIATRSIEPFGIELLVDLRSEFDPVEAQEFRHLFEVHDLVLVRGNVLTMEEQLRVCALLGPVLHSDSGLMTNDTVIGLAGVELVYHSDYGYSPEPLQAISLHAVDVVDGETSTRFAGGRHGYESLSPSMQQRVADLSALQVFGAQLDRRNRLSELDPVLPSTIHALAQPHDATGSRWLFAPQMLTDSIVGLPEEESEAIIAEIFGALYAPSQILEHRWHVGDFVIFHNMRVVHARGDVSKVARRVLQRVTLGTKGYLDLYPHLADYEWDNSGTMIEGDAFAS